MDADFSHDFRQIPRILEKLEQADFVIGSRYTPGGRIENWSWPRRLLSRGANFYIKQILDLPSRDVTTGYTAFKKSVIKQVGPHQIVSRGYSFLVEFKYLVAQAGFIMAEHPIVFRERRHGQSKLSGRVIWESLLLPWQLRLRRGPFSAIVKSHG